MIPTGQCTTYGHIASLIGFPRHARMVGRALHDLQAEEVPWQRVVSASGHISAREPPGAAERQAVLLRQEGVEVTTSNAIGGEQFVGSLGGHVNLRRFGWFPNNLQSL